MVIDEGSYNQDFGDIRSGENHDKVILVEDLIPVPARRITIKGSSGRTIERHIYNSKQIKELEAKLSKEVRA